MKVDGTPDRERGFTLLEALCTITIIALILSVTVPSLLRTPDRAALEVATRQIAALLPHAKAEAIATNSETVVEIDADRRIITPRGPPPLQLDSAISLALITAREESRGAGNAGIRFFPDGSSSGGEIVLKMRRRTVKISVNWLDGEPRVAGAATQNGALTKP